MKNIYGEDVKVGSKVRVDVFKYKGFQGEVVEILDGMASIKVPVYYNVSDEPFVMITREVKTLRLRK